MIEKPNMQLSTNLEEQNLHLRKTTSFLWKQLQLVKAENKKLSEFLEEYMRENST